jgi:tetratricopeptide (TPR) repeat protein
MKQAREQFDKGLKISPEYSEMIIDYGTTYLGDFYNEQTNPEKANEYLDKAIEKLSIAYQINPKNSNSSLKLSICFMYKENCEKAIEYLEIAERLGNPNITDQYKNELEETCRVKDLDCSDIKTGKFKHLSEEYGETIIERTIEYQIEESIKYGDKIKLKITWIDDCTYQLQPVEDLSNPENNEIPTMILTSTITEITKNGYIQISSSNGNPMKIKSEIIRMEK